MKDLNVHACGRTADEKDRLVHDLNLTLEEQITLTVARLFFQSFSTPEGYTWLAAMAEAEARFGYVDGPLIAARLLAALQVIRRSRRSTFMFNSPTCPGCAAIATEHERRLMTALSCIRRGDKGTARVEVIMLCEGHRTEMVLSALDALGRALDGKLPANVRPCAHERMAE